MPTAPETTKLPPNSDTVKSIECIQETICNPKLTDPDDEEQKPERKKSQDMETIASEMDGELDFEAEAGEIEAEAGEIEAEAGEIEAEAGEIEADVDNAEQSNVEKGEDSDEDGQCTPEREEKDESLEEGEDDGEISDDGDFEEGEVIESSPTPKQPTRQVCKFFMKGQCTWGNQCRFLHVNAGSKGNYNMFDLAPRLPHFFPPRMPPPHMVLPRMMCPPPHMMPNFMPIPLPMIRPLLPMPPPPLPCPEEEEEEEEEPPPPSDDWEATLRETKALVRKASYKKDDHQHTRDYNKENDFKTNKNYRRKDKNYRHDDNYNNDGNNEWGEEYYENDESYKERRERIHGTSEKRERSKDSLGRDRRPNRSGSYTSLSSLTFSDSSRSRSYSRSRSSRSHSRTRSHSRGRTRSRSRSRSFSRSLSMDSVSSASTHPSSTHGSSGHRRRLDLKTPITSSLGEELQKTKMKIKEEPVDESDLPPLPPRPPEAKPQLQLHHLLPFNEGEESKTTKPVKFTFKKSSKSKVIDLDKVTEIDKSKEAEAQRGVKRPHSDESQKTAGSRRDELLKQLKAVEDAIARKRAK